MYGHFDCYVKSACNQNIQARITKVQVFTTKGQIIPQTSGKHKHKAELKIKVPIAVGLSFEVGINSCGCPMK